MAKDVVKGVLKLGDEERPFSREFEASSEARAHELAYTYFGSQNGLRRSNIKIQSSETGSKV